DDPRVAERFELYIAGVELANGFFELNDEAEQRRRLVEEREARRRLGRTPYPLDERFLEAVGRLPPSAGVATGLDRLLMILGGWTSIEEVLLFPAAEEYAVAEEVPSVKYPDSMGSLARGLIAVGAMLVLAGLALLLLERFPGFKPGRLPG